MRRFGSDRIKQVLERLNDDEDIVIKSRMLTRQVGFVNVSKEITTILVNKSFSTMTLCVNNVKSSTLSVMMLSTAERDLEPEIKALGVRLIVR